MSDVSLSSLGSAQSPLGGLTADDYAGYGSGSNQSSPSFFGDFSGSQIGGAAALGAGALGFGSILARGESPLPAQFQQLEGNVPGLRQQSQALTTAGNTLVGQGTEALGMAQRGELTPEQKAQLGVFSQGLDNKTRQQFAAMGRNPEEDTGYLGQTAANEQQINAMAQEQIRTTLATGFGEISAGQADISQGLQFNNAADKILYDAAQAQIQQDKAYGDSLTSAFSSIATMFAKAAPLLLA